MVWLSPLAQRWANRTRYRVRMCAHAYEVYGWLSFANKGPMYGQATTS